VTKSIIRNNPNYKQILSPKSNSAKYVDKKAIFVEKTAKYVE
jgi:hypothetical protein